MDIDKIRKINDPNNSGESDHNIPMINDEDINLHQYRNNFAQNKSNNTE